MPKSKLYRNLKPGDKFTVGREDGKRATVTVSSVHETKRAWFSGKRQWIVNGDYPYWWSVPIHAYSTDRIDLV